MHLRSRTWLSAGLGLVWLAGPVHAQTSTVDEGAFRIQIDGRDVGTETFSVRQTGTGASAIIIAQGRVELDAAANLTPLSASLELSGAGLRPAAYQVEVRGDAPQRIAGRLVGGRFSARIRSAAGEMMREYLASEGATLLDDGVAHHYYFIGRRYAGEAVQVPVIIPRQSRQLAAQVTPGSDEEISIAGGSTGARTFTVSAGGVDRRVWIDAQGRVLRVEIPAQKYVAARVALPR